MTLILLPNTIFKMIEIIFKTSDEHSTKLAKFVFIYNEKKSLNIFLY